MFIFVNCEPVNVWWDMLMLFLGYDYTFLSGIVSTHLPKLLTGTFEILLFGMRSQIL